MPKKSKTKAEQKPTETTQPQSQLTEIARHPLKDGELVMLAEIQASNLRINTMIGKFLTERFGYDENRNLAFGFDWKNKHAIVYERSNIEVAKDATPPAPVKGEAS